VKSPLHLQYLQYGWYGIDAHTVAKYSPFAASANAPRGVARMIARAAPE
jgi:hypothetical protein